MFDEDKFDHEKGAAEVEVFSFITFSSANETVPDKFISKQPLEVIEMKTARYDNG